MSYRRLPFIQYFINTSQDYTGTGQMSYPLKYDRVGYSSGPLEKLFGLYRTVYYEIHYEPDRDAIQMNFRRSVKVTDWIANLDFPSKYYHAIEFEHQPLQLRVHRGWGMMYMAIKQDVRALWRQYHQRYPSAETEIVGWSLGSSLAILCAQDLNYNFGVRPYLYTFGTVRPFKTVRSNVDRMQRYLSTVCTECWNFSNVNDLISYLPPFPGFRMIHRVNVETEKSLSLFRIVHPFHYHIDYDRETLYEPYENGADPDGPEGRAVRALRGRKKR